MRSFWKRASTILACIFFVSCRVFATEPAPAALRIGINYFGEANRISLSSASGLSIIRTGSTEHLASVSTQSQVRLEANAGSIELFNFAQDLGASVTAVSVDQSKPIEISTESRHRQYLGAIELRAEGGIIRVVNVVALEDYTRGVVPAEMPDSYPIEALKAQAVCARTYALYSLGKHSAHGFDLCDSGHCQNYLGVPSGKPAGARAVAETAGQVLTWNGRPASTLYSTDCGGATQDCGEIRPGSAFPYLVSVQDPPEANHQCWEQSYRLDELEERLTKAGVTEAQGLQSITVAKIGSSGRALAVQVTGRQASVSISGDKLRTILGEPIKSTLFTIEQADDGQVIFKGKGVGHGLGLCQVGTKALALPPYNYTYSQILDHYFPGTSLSPAGAADTSGPAPSNKALSNRAAAHRKQRPPRHKPQPTPETGNVDIHVRVKAPDTL